MPEDCWCSDPKPGKLVRWSTIGGFDEWSGTTVTWEIKPGKDGVHEVWFDHSGWPETLPSAELASKYAETGKPTPFFP